MIRKVIQAIVALVFIVIGYTKLEGSIFQKNFIWYGLVGLVGLVVLLLEFIYINRKRLWMSIFSKYLALRGKNIRFSMSYLYRIEIEDKYFIACHLFDDEYKDSPKYDWEEEEREASFRV